MKDLDFSVAEQRVLAHCKADFDRRMRQAAAKGWKMDRSEARALVDLGIGLCYIDPSQRNSLVEALRRGECVLIIDGDRVDVQRSNLLMGVIAPLWSIRYTLLFIALALSLGFLAGCTTSAPCETCIGPYDLTLSSHREALGLEE